MININYSEPASDATHLEGIWETDSDSGTFRIPIIYVSGSQDIEATVEKMKTIQQTALDMESLIS